MLKDTPEYKVIYNELVKHFKGVVTLPPDIIKNCAKEITKKIITLPPVDESVISKLTEDQKFYITLIAMLSRELVSQLIITPTQRSQIERYVLEKMK